jgi:hypothetical protein
MPEQKTKQCEGIRELDNLWKCENEATYKVEGLAAQFGAPLTSYLCEDCKSAWESQHPDGTNDAIMEYNQFKVIFTKIIPGQANE